MSAGALGGGRQSAAGRLVARARRPAVRARTDAYGFQPFELAESAQAPSSQVAALVAPRPGAVRPARAPAPAAPRSVEVPAASLHAPFAEQTSSPPGRVAVAAGDATTRPPLLERPDPPASPSPVDQQTDHFPIVEAAIAAGWHALADPDPAPAPARTAGPPEPTAAGRAPAAVGAPPPSATADRAQPASALERPARASTPAREPQPPRRNQPVAPQTSAAPPPARPQVLIERIDVITPPAAPPASDPFASLAPRRTGASRHGGGR